MGKHFIPYIVAIDKIIELKKKIVLMLLNLYHHFKNVVLIMV